MPKIILDGHTGTDEFFKKNSVFESERLTHTPFLVFVEEENAVHVRIIDNPRKLLSFSNETQVMVQWPGEWRSDYFQFTVGEYRHFIEGKNTLLLSARDVVKRVGPKGGFRMLSYQYVNEQGVLTSSYIMSRAQAEEIEAVFAQHNIPVSVEIQR
jgi:hypothetical protein